MPAHLIDDVVVPRAVWTPLTPDPALIPPPGRITIANRGAWLVLVKRAALRPVDARGAWRLGPGQVAPPEDLRPWGALRLWAFAAGEPGLVAVEALWPDGAPSQFGPAFSPDFF